MTLTFTNGFKDAIKTLSGPSGMYAHWKAFMGIPQSSDGVPHGLQAMGKVPADESWVYTCVSILGYAVAGIPLRVQVKQTTNGRIEWIDNDDAPDAVAKSLGARDLQLLLDDVNAEWDGARLQLYTEVADGVHGGSYYAKVRGRLGGPPQELHWLSAAEVEPQRDDRGHVVGYEHRPSPTAASKQYKTTDIVPFRRFNLLDPATIVSPLEAARYNIASLRRQAEWNANLIGNWGIPPGAWIADEKSDFAPTELNAIKRALRAIRGQDGAGKIPVLPGGLTWVPLSMSQKDADWLGAGQVDRMTICGILGVPLEIAGAGESNVYAGGRDAERIMYRKLIPRLDARASTMDSFIVPDFDRERRIRIRYDYSTIEAMKAPPAEEMQAWQGWVQAGVPLNNAMDYFGMPRVEGGDEPRWMGKTTADMEQKRKARIRPSDYQVNTGQGREAVRSLGNRLYKHPAVRAWIEQGKPDGLLDIVDPEQLPAFMEGLRQRMSAEQIATGPLSR